MTQDAARGRTIVPKPVAVAMTVAVSLPLLISLPGVLAFLTDNLTGGARNALGFCVCAVQNALALFACVLTLRSTTRYLLPSTASVLTFVAWFWLSFTSLPVALVLAGTVVSISIGIWSFAVLRKPEVRAAFGTQFDPVDSIARFVLPRLPKFKIDPTARNVNLASATALCSICLLGIAVGSLLGKGDSIEKAAAASRVGDAAKSKSLAALLKKSDDSWDAGKKDAAVEGYLQIINLEAYDRGAFEDEHKLDLSRIYNRVVDYRVATGGPEAARDVIRKASRERVARITFTNPRVSQVVTQERGNYSRELHNAAESMGDLPGERSSGGGREEGEATGDVDYNTALRAAQSRDAKLKGLSAEMEAGGMNRNEFMRRKDQIMQEYQGDLGGGKAGSSSRGKTDAELFEEGRQMRRQLDKENPGLGKMIEDTRDRLRAKQD